MPEQHIHEYQVTPGVPGVHEPPASPQPDPPRRGKKTTTRGADEAPRPVEEDN